MVLLLVGSNFLVGLFYKMTEKEKKELEILIKENGYNEELQNIY